MTTAGKNRLIVAAAGSGKTTYVVKRALASIGKNILITTYTQANKDEIVAKIVELNGTVPSNIEVATWFSFLLLHGAKPYQGSMGIGKINGLLFVNSLSALGIPETNTERYYCHDRKIYSDKLAKFVVRCNDSAQGSVFSRLSRIYSDVYIDEVQDMCGYDLEIISHLFDSTLEVVLVGDPRQATYTTHPDNKLSQYSRGGIVKFIEDKCSTKCVIDYTTLGNSHRNHTDICRFSSLIFPEHSSTDPCDCKPCRNTITHSGVFLVPQGKIELYSQLVEPVVLRYSRAEYPEWNFGQAKGKTFQHVLIYPTADFENYLIDGRLEKKVSKKGKQKVKDRFDRSKLYVASTRARYSLAVVCSDKTIQTIAETRLAELSASIY